MREALDRYIRSLAEQEQEREAPETRQDLGTFVYWLLEELGFRIWQKTFVFEGVERRKNSGKPQFGVDVLAVKRSDPDRVYRFVLKSGNVGAAQWGARAERNTIVHDIFLAAGLHKRAEAWKTLSDEPFRKISVVAVHNGDLDLETMGPHLAQLRDDLQLTGVDLEWWDANVLVDLCLNNSQLNASLFPPGIRPFARVFLDSVRLGNQEKYNESSIDRLLSVLLPLDEEDRGIDNRQAHRLFSEVALLLRMAEIEVVEVQKRSVLIVLTAIERSLCRVMAVLGTRKKTSYREFQKPISEILRALLSRYRVLVEMLSARLSTVSSEPYGLSLAGLNERIDYPIRAFRLAGFLSRAAVSCLDQGQYREVALSISAVLFALYKTNVCAFCQPITDDQIVELASMWELWLSLGQSKYVVEHARGIARYHVERRRGGYPLPALRQRTHAFANDEDIRVLSETYIRGRTSAPPSFVDESSTLLSLVLYSLIKLDSENSSLIDQLVPSFAEIAIPSKSSDRRRRSQGEGADRTISLQAWIPPEEAAEEWYVKELQWVGKMWIFTLWNGSRQSFVEEFEAANQVDPLSPASDWGVPVVDRMAWANWRTPPPMALFVKLIRRLAPESDVGSS